MPKAVGRASQRKRKAKKQPTEENYASSSESNVKLIKVLKGELSNASLDDCNNDFAEFQSSRAPARKKRRQNPGGEEITRKGVSSSVKTISVVEKNATGEDDEKSSREKHSKQSVRFSPRIKEKSNVSRGSSKIEDVTEVKDGKKISEHGKKKQVKGGDGVVQGRKEAEPVSCKKVTETESKQLESGQGEKEELTNRGVGFKDSTEGGTGEELVPCPCCGRTAPEIFPDGQGDMNNHALVCLHQKFGSNDGESNKPGNFSGKDSKMLKENEVTRCQICNRAIDHLSTRKRTEHVNRCIDNATHSYANGNGSVKQSLHVSYNGSTTTDDEDEVVCQICHKNISHMNSRRRTQHVNRCIDSNSEEMKTTTPPSQDQPQQEPDVPNCIICGTSLNTHQKRKSHLKKCARENNISTLQLLEMVKKQELSSRDKPVSIEKPVNGQQQENVKPREALSTGPATKAHKPRKKKKDDLDEDVQVAMAISASIAEQDEKEKRALGITNENLPDMLDTASSKAEGVKKKKTKKGRGRPAKHKPLNFPALLTRTSPENRKMWSEKISAIVEASLQQKRDVGKTPQNEKSGLARIYSKIAGEWEVIGQTNESQCQDKTTKPIWQLSRCDALLGNTPFYVNTLKPYLSPPRASKPRTKRLRFEPSPHRETVTEADRSDPCSPADDRIHGAITQETVDALMGLAMEDEDDTRRRSLSPSASGFIRRKHDTSDDEVPVKATDDITQEQYRLLESLRDLVDSPLLDPLTIKTKDGQEIHAHLFILQLRCPALVKDASNGGKETLPETIHLPDFTKSELLAVMSYLYAGDVCFSDSDVQQIEKFAKRYHLKELQDICSKRISKLHERIVTPSKGEEQEKDIQDLIQSIWDDKNDQDASSQAGETSSESLDDPPNLADLTEIYEVASSQKSRYVDESSSSDDDSSDNNNRMDKMNGEVDNKKDDNGDRDADGEGGADEISRDRRTQRGGTLQNGRQGSASKETGRTVKERGGEEGESCEDVSLDDDGSRRGKDEKRRSGSEDDELFGSFEGGNGGLENGLMEGADHMHKGDKIGEAQNDEVMKDTVVERSEESLLGCTEEEEGAEITSEVMDTQTFAGKTRRSSRTGLRKDGREGEETDVGNAVDEDELAVKSQSAIIAKRSYRRQSVERMDKGRSSTESLNEDDGTKTDSTMEENSSRKSKRGTPKKKVVSQNGQSSPSVERGVLISDLPGRLAWKETPSNLIAGEKKEGSPVFTSRKRSRPPKTPSGRKGEGGVSTSSQSDDVDKVVVVSPLEVTNQASSGEKDGQRGKNFSQKEDLPLITMPRKRGRPRKYKVIEKEEISRRTTSSESDTLDQQKLAPVSSPQSCRVSREKPPGITPRKSGRAQKNRSVKKKVETKTNSKSKSLDQAVSSPSSQVSTLSGSASDTDAYSVGKEGGALTPTPRKRGRSKKISVINTGVGRMESSESDHLDLSQSKVSLKTSENCKGSQDEHNGGSAKENSYQVLKRKRGRPRKSEGLLKGAKKDDSQSDDNDGAVIGDKAIGKGEKRTDESPVAGDSSTVFPYLLLERRWSLRSPQSQEAQEKEELSPLGKSKSPLTKNEKKNSPVRTPFTKLATKKQSFKFKKIRSPLLRGKQKDDKNVTGKKRPSGSSLLNKRQSKDGLSRSDTKSPKNTSSKKTSTATETADMVNGNEQSESSKDHHLDVSDALFNEDVPKVEGTPKGVRNTRSMDSSVIAKPTNDFFSENYKVSETFKFTASTPNDYLKYKDTISPLKVNLGRKVTVLLHRSVNSSGEEIEQIQDMNTSKGKENVPELTDRDSLTPVGVDKTLNFDDNDGDVEDDDGVLPVVSPSPIHLSPSRVPETNPDASSPVFSNSLGHQEHETTKSTSQQSVEESGEEIAQKDENSESEEMENHTPLRKDSLDVSPCKSLNGSMSFSEGLCIGRDNDEELVSRSLSSQPIVSLSRRIPGSPVDKGKKVKEDSPAETDMSDEELKGSERVGEDEANSVIVEEQIQSVVEKSSKDDSNGDDAGEIADVEDEETEVEETEVEETDVPRGIDNAEDFAFDLEGENFVESLHLSQEETVRTGPGATGVSSPKATGVSSPSSFGQPERVSSPSVRKNSEDSGNKDAMVDSIDLTNDDDDDGDEAVIVRSVVLDEIDLTDNEEIDLTDDEGVTEDVDPPASISVTPRVEVHHSAEEASGPTSVSQEMVNGDALPEEIRILPVIEGCSRSFVEDLAAAPSAEVWSDGELDMAQENHNQAAFPANQPAAQILNARSISLEEFCSPAPLTPMPPYDEMVTPQLAEELNRYGVKKLKRKQARLKLKELYHYTHQVMQEDESAGETTDERNKEKQAQEQEPGKHKGANISGKSAKSKKNSTKPPKESKTGSKSSLQSKPNADSVFAEPSKVLKSRSGAKTGAGKSGKAKGDKKRQSERETHLEAEKMDTDISSQSSGSDERDDFGESILYDEDPDDITPSQSTSNAEDSIQKYIWNNTEFYQKCLQFQPFDLDKFQAELKANDIKVSKPKLMAILDAKCLTFRHKNRNRRSPKKKKKVP